MKFSKTGIAFSILVTLVIGWPLAKHFWQSPKFINGETAPDFSIQLKTGETARLSDLRGKFVLLQFWGSWCGPCRRENPHLKTLLNEFGPRGFEIFSIAIERNAEAWNAAIERDGIGWKYHAAEFSDDLQFFSGPVVGLFKVRAIPQTYLIDPKGLIIGVNLPPDQLEKTLSTRLPK